MPQLDTLTYFSQYAYLAISFIGTYVLVLTLIVPNLVALLKLRQKLNSLSSLSASLGEAHRQAPLAGDAGTESYATHQRLAGESWYDALQKSRGRTWSYTSALMQTAACVRLKKTLAKVVLQVYGS